MKKLVYFLVFTFICSSLVSFGQYQRGATRIGKSRTEQALRSRYQSPSSERILPLLQKEFAENFGYPSNTFPEAISNHSAQYTYQLPLNNNRTVVSPPPLIIGKPPKGVSMSRPQRGMSTTLGLQRPPKPQQAVTLLKGFPESALTSLPTLPRRILSRTQPRKVDFAEGTIEFTLENGPQKNDYETIGQLRDDHGTLYKDHEIKKNLNNESFHDVREELLEGKLLEVFQNSGYTESKLLLEFQQDDHEFHLLIFKSPIEGGSPIPIDECQLGGKLYIKTATRTL